MAIKIRVPVLEVFPVLVVHEDTAGRVLLLLKGLCQIFCVVLRDGNRIPQIEQREIKDPDEILIDFSVSVEINVQLRPPDFLRLCFAFIGQILILLSLRDL